MVDQIRCQTCGVLFTPRTSGGKPQVRCSEKCRRKVANANYIKARSPKRNTNCAECGAPIIQPDTGRPRRFCSTECKARAGNRASNRRRLPVDQPPERACAQCGKTFQPKRSDSKYCYDNWCAQRAYQQRRASGAPLLMVQRTVQCGECGTDFVGTHPRARWCSRTCQIRHRARSSSRRRGPASIDHQPYTDLEIFERDGWFCQICGTAVDRSLPRTHRDGATIDHVIPLSKGGADSPENVVTSHWRCNRDKGAKHDARGQEG